MGLPVFYLIHSYFMADFSQSHKSPILTKNILTIVFSFLTIIGAKIQVQVWEIPFTLQTIAVYGSGIFLGWQWGGLSQLIYLFLGLFFPVFAGEGQGVDYLLNRTTSGYLLSFPVVSAITGFLSQKWKSAGGNFISLQAGSLTLFAAGVLWLHFAANHPSWEYSLVNGWIKFIPVDQLKILTVWLIYLGMKHKFVMYSR